MPLESDLGQLELSLPGRIKTGLRSKIALLSKKFKDNLFGMLANVSFRLTVTNYNRQSSRREDELVTISKLTKYVEQEGEVLLQKKAEETADILASLGCFDIDGVFRKDKQLPESLQSGECEWINIDAPKVADQMAERGEGDISNVTVDQAISMNKDELADLFGGPSAPFSDKTSYKRKRRDSRTELPPECKSERLQNYASWLNSQECLDRNRKILHQWKIEKDSSQTVCITIDAVLVAEQSKVHVKGGKPVMKDEKTYIKHWDIRIDADKKSYFVSSVDETEAYKELLAILIKNQLINRYPVFFIDGETKIYNSIERYFAPWPHAVYLDFHHMEEKIHTLMSLMVVSKRVDDPSAETEVYKIGPKAGQPKDAPKTSLSQLYAKSAICMAWSGNIPELVAYIRLIPDSDIKNESARNDLLRYIKNKQDWITCYRLRKIAGLQNSSNAVEQENQMVVSRRQKDELMSWCETGSANVAALSVLYCNKEQDIWYDDRKIDFRLWENGDRIKTVA